MELYRECKMMARFYLAVVQAVLLYGADSWALTQRDMKFLTAFHHRAIRFMTGQHIKKINDKEWFYPNHGELLKSVVWWKSSTMWKLGGGL